MNTCCETYGHCEQGRTCPTRTGTVLPHQAEHAANVARIKTTRSLTCDQLGICQGRGDCDCAHPERIADMMRSPVPTEAGNMNIIDLGPDDTWQALTLGDAWRWLRPNLPMLGGVVLLVVGAGLLSAYGTERYADVLWQLLAGVS